MDYLFVIFKMVMIVKEFGFQFRIVMDLVGILLFFVDFVLLLKQVLNNIFIFVFVFLDWGYSVIFILFMYLLNYDKNFMMDRVVVISYVLGMDLSMKCINQKLCKVIGENVEFFKLDNLLKQWLNYWQVIFVYKNWFVVG